MALSKTVTANNTVEVLADGIALQTEVAASASAYIKVERVDSSKFSAIAYVSYSGEKVTGNKTFEFIPNLDSAENFIKQAYAHLKTLPEFNSAQDC